MNKSRSLATAIDLAKTALASNDGKLFPNETNAQNLADFIETLAKRLENMGDDD